MTHRAPSCSSSSTAGAGARTRPTTPWPPRARPPSMRCGRTARMPSSAPAAPMSACRRGRWAIPRSGTSISAPAASSCRTCRASPPPSRMARSRGLPALTGLIARLQGPGGTCHLMGLLSPGGVHSHQDHAVALARILDRRRHPVAIHALTDGRDTAPEAAPDFLAKFEPDIAGLPACRRRHRHRPLFRDGPRQPLGPRQRGLRRQSRGEGAHAASGRGRGRRRACRRQDRRVRPRHRHRRLCAGMQDGDGLLCFNFRADRVRADPGRLRSIPAFARLPPRARPSASPPPPA